MLAIVALTRHGIVLCFVLPLLWAAPALAAVPVRRVVMAWSQDDASCIGASELASIVEHTLARPVFHAEAAPFAEVRGSVGRVGPDRFEARIALVAMDGRVLASRTLTTSGACARLDESVAVVVTLMIDGVEEAPTPLLIPAGPPRADAGSAHPQAPSPPASPRPASLALTLGVGAGLSSALLPGFVASFGVRGEVAVSSFVPIALTLRVHAPSTTQNVTGQGARFNAWTGEVGACPAWSNGRARLGGCLGLGGGAIEGDHVNLSDGASHVRPVLLATLLPFAAVRLAGPAWARVEAGAWFPLLRERWGYVDAHGAFQELFRMAPVVPAAMFTLELHAGS